MEPRRQRCAASLCPPTINWPRTCCSKLRMTLTAWCRMRSLVWGLSWLRCSWHILPSSLNASLMSRTLRRSRALLATRRSRSRSNLTSGGTSSSSSSGLLQEGGDKGSAPVAWGKPLPRHSSLASSTAKVVRKKPVSKEYTGTYPHHGRSSKCHLFCFSFHWCNYSDATALGPIRVACWVLCGCRTVTCALSEFFFFFCMKPQSTRNWSLYWRNLLIFLVWKAREHLEGQRLLSENVRWSTRRDFNTWKKKKN